ncbi:16S rRNA (cytosine967-C5)-methyltransferase [Arachidicoccus rhizosphaerae]|jgi:16S rRNA (cytosine967-C5)-methyltransferase|uniref:16S rRNA (Cytosine967-C5)-methyltransferase n=1 Tax=Arachidicoccus rhizosphaerae TaxID=551991 RepID=A0A1H4CYR1_9BACT|nr:hypothetical protein [Arachidicoccus rhizosphaerae]SEA65232.1 16S rRNA (cytosine967-C5)-methyltransferase [Arachidicoccus rhizosphaerae]
MDIPKIIDRHKQTAALLLQSYDHKEPLHLFLKKYFAAHKKHGSKDRKYITKLLYSYFRLGKNIQVLQQQVPLNVALDISCFITENIALPEFITDLYSGDAVSKSKKHQELTEPEDRFALVKTRYTDLEEKRLFPFQAAVSKGLDKTAIAYRLLHQVDVFLRVRVETGIQMEAITEKLLAAAVPYRQLSGTCISVPAATPTDQYLAINREVVIQDSSSQQMSQFMELALKELSVQKLKGGAGRGPLKIWDCCAASGGKSILVKDLATALQLPVKLMATDIRPGILKNLETRFKAAAITGYHQQVVDLTRPGPLPFQGDFDLIVCDAPCSGSGTWARNPEQIQSFEEQSLEDYYQKQTAIVRKAWSRLRPGGYFLYMTCSVFEKENEQVSRYIALNSGMELLLQKVVTGFAQNQVSMFGALYTRKK